jgi:TP901 family phage tail tape measure protein
MSPGGAPTLELESLFVRIYTEHAGFIAGVSEVMSAVDLLEKKLLAFAATINTSLTTTFAPFALALGRVGSFLNSVTIFNPARFSSLIGPLDTFTNQFATLSQTLSGSIPAFQATSLMFHRIGSLLRGSTIANIGGMTTALDTLLPTLKNLMAVGAGPGAANLATTLGALSKLSSTKLLANAAALQALITPLSQLAIIGSLPGMANIAVVLSNIKGVTAAKIATASAAGGAVPPVNNLTNAMRNLGPAAVAAGAGLNTARLSIGAFIGFGLFQFAKLEDRVTRLSAVMRRMPGFEDQSAVRGMFMEGLTKMSTDSITSVQDLAKGLEVLTLRGYDANAAMGALPIVENFAVASGMKMEEAAKKLAVTLDSLGITTYDMQSNYRNLTRLSDLFTASAGRSGGTIKDMAEAFTPTFSNAIRHYKVGLEDAIGLQAAFILHGKKGSEAGEAAARLLRMLPKANVKELPQWKALMGGRGVYDANNQMRPIADIIKDLNDVLGDTASKSAEARAQLSGLVSSGGGGGGGAMETLRPILRLSAFMKEVTESVKNMGGITEQVAADIRTSLLSVLLNLWQIVKAVAISIGMALAPALWVIAKIIGTVAKAFLELNPLLRAAAVWFGIFYFAGGPIVKLFSWIGSAALSLGKTLAWMVLELPIHAFNAAWTVVATTFKTIWWAVSGIGSAIGSLISGGISTVVGLISMLFNPLGIITLIAGVAAVAVLFSSLHKDYGSISKGLSDIGSKTGSAIRSGVESVRSGFETVADAGIDAWYKVRAATRGWFEEAAGYIKKIAGFFWNFRENMPIIVGFVQNNWREMAAELGTVFAVLIENLMKSISRLASFIGKAVTDVWNTTWSNAGLYFSDIGRFIKSQWKNILEDIGAYVKAFVISIAYNIGAATANSTSLVKAIASATKASYLRPEYEAGLPVFNNVLKMFEERNKERKSIDAPPLTFERFLEGLAWEDRELAEMVRRFQDLRTIMTNSQESVASAMKDISSAFKSPQDFMEGYKTKTSFGGLGFDFDVSNLTAQSNMAFLRSRIADMWKNTSFPSPLQGFQSAIADAFAKLKLNFGLPEDAGDKLVGFMNRLTGGGPPGEGAGPALGKGNVGFQFKQISLERTMLGGPTAESLDYQQLVQLRQINAGVARVAAANEAKGNQGPPQSWWDVPQE